MLALSRPLPAVRMPERTLLLWHLREHLGALEPGGREVLRDGLIGAARGGEQVRLADARPASEHAVNRRTTSRVQRRGPSLAPLVGVRRPDDAAARPPAEVEALVAYPQDRAETAAPGR